MSAASGSLMMLASADGDALPPTNALPPMRTIPASFDDSVGSSCIAVAMLVSGPRGTSVISPGASSTVRMMKFGASSSCTDVGGRRQEDVALAVGPVHERDRPTERHGQWLIDASRHRDVGAARDLQQLQGVGRGDVDLGIAEDRREPDDVELG